MGYDDDVDANFKEGGKKDNLVCTYCPDIISNHTAKKCLHPQWFSTKNNISSNAWFFKNKHNLFELYTFDSKNPSESPSNDTRLLANISNTPRGISTNSSPTQYQQYTLLNHGMSITGENEGINTTGRSCSRYSNLTFSNTTNFSTTSVVHLSSSILTKIINYGAKNHIWSTFTQLKNPINIYYFS